MAEVDHTQSLLLTPQILNPSQEREGGRQTTKYHKTNTIMPESVYVDT